MTTEELERDFWRGNEKASELWRVMQTDLRDVGFTWATFLVLLRMCKREIVLYQAGAMSMRQLRGVLDTEANDLIGQLILETRR